MVNAIRDILYDVSVVNDRGIADKRRLLDPSPRIASRLFNIVYVLDNLLWLNKYLKMYIPLLFLLYIIICKEILIFTACFYFFSSHIKFHVVFHVETLTVLWCTSKHIFQILLYYDIQITGLIRWTLLCIIAWSLFSLKAAARVRKNQKEKWNWF